MKRFLALWLLLAISLPGGLICQGTCANKNSMLEKLRGAGVTIYALPKPNSQYCSDEWKPNGTCCDPLSAGAAMKRKTDKNTQEVATMIREIESLPGALQAFQLKAELMMPYSSRGQTRQKMQKVVDYINSNKRNIQNSQSGCMKRLNSVTRASTCNICSGQSQRFFNGKKILMRQEDCRDIIDDCEQAWRSVVHILDLLETYTTEVKKTYKGKLADEHFDSLKSVSSAHQLAKYFDKCPSLKNCPINKVASICENLISIMAPSYADYVAGQIQETKKTVAGKILQKIGKFFKNGAKAIAKGIKSVGKAIGGLFRRKKKRGSSSAPTSATSSSFPSQSAVGSQGKISQEFHHKVAKQVASHMTWKLSSRHDSPRKLSSEGNEGFQKDNNGNSTSEFLFGGFSDVMVSKDANCPDCPVYSPAADCP